MEIYQAYLSLLKKYKRPQDFWKKWCQKEKSGRDREEIVLGAILTQRTNWLNVELALENLKRAKVLSLKKIYQISKQDIILLENMIRPAGFYRQKAIRIFRFCEFVAENYGTLQKFFKQDLAVCRQQLLEISGIGPETADSILLYAGDKPVFVIDEYTRRFVKKHRLSSNFSYDHLQQLFQKNLLKKVKIYQDFHAMIVLAGKA